VRVAERGQVTIPKRLRDLYRIERGQEMTVLDLGGAFLYVPGASRVDTMCDALRDRLLGSGATLEGMLADLRAMRERDGE
jgi:bifunctional DNA-binding transcriptional regulator/antitoxin component of YhaV-PrlF toxin-antitoxin module